MIPLILLSLAFAFHGIAKGFGDYLIFGGFSLVRDRFPKWFADWVFRVGPAGNPFKCDLWHFCMGHVAQWCICLGVIGGAFYGVSWWLVPICWAGYFLEGRIFVYVFHVKLMRDWTLQFWIRDTFKFW